MSHARFVRKLCDQLNAIELSRTAYDAGNEAEAVRLATSIRVLFHKTKRQTPLVELLGRTNTTMLSTTHGDSTHYGFVNVRINLASSIPVSCAPKLGSTLYEISLRQWWDTQVVYQFNKNSYHRRDVVTTAANQDGGAHVDSHLEPFYEDLLQGTQVASVRGTELVYAQPAPFDQALLQRAENTHLAMIRQFAHEVLVSAAYFNWMAW